MFKWFKKKQPVTPDAPVFWHAYLEGVGTGGYDKRTPLEEVSFVVFDTETTGLRVQEDRLLSIGAVRVKNSRLSVQDRLECYLRQAYQPDHQAVAVHGILPGGRRGGRLSEEESLHRFLEYIGGDVLVAHHAGFDLAMLNAGLNRLGCGKLQNKVVDTGVLARRVIGSPSVARAGTYGLDQLCEQYHIPKSDRHTAPGDAFITALLLMKLLYRLKKRGVDTLGRLLSAPGLGL